MDLEVQDIMMYFPAHTRLTIVKRDNGMVLSNTDIANTYDYTMERISTIKAVSASHIVITVF